MIVVCPMCGHHGNISDKLVPKNGRDIVCPKCREEFFISKDQIIQGEKPEKSIPDTKNPDCTLAVADQADIYHLVCPRCGATVNKPENLKGNTYHCEFCNSIVVIK